eukprot:jgi/Mesen1/8912/ME000545S08411
MGSRGRPNGPTYTSSISNANGDTGEAYQATASRAPAKTTHAQPPPKAAVNNTQELATSVPGPISAALPNDVQTLQQSVAHHVKYTIGCRHSDPDTSTVYLATAHSVRERVIERWTDTEEHYKKTDAKRVYYLSLEYLTGRSLQNSVYNLGLQDEYGEALRRLGYNLEEAADEERDPALGNGGLGRLASCFLDSMATLNYPAWGYGIRYKYGMFEQRIQSRRQVEYPDYWLHQGNPWEVPQLAIKFPVRFYGYVIPYSDGRKTRFRWEGGEIVKAVAYDTPIPGYHTTNTNNMRLWSSQPCEEFDLQSFNAGLHVSAVEARARAEAISSVLYPNDNTDAGKELRLKQQFFFVSATLQDILERFKKSGRPLSELPTKVAVQLNDTHPTIAIPELMRLLMDQEDMEWVDAWDVTVRTFAYTNHTILPEALERWSVPLVQNLLPRHMEIIFEINHRHLKEVSARWRDDTARLTKMSIIEESHPKMVRMAVLATVGSHTVNGVALIHSGLVRTRLFPEFVQLSPYKFQNKTNGVTPRRWILLANPSLSSVGVVATLSLLPSSSSLKESSQLRPSGGLGRWLRVVTVVLGGGGLGRLDQAASKSKGKSMLCAEEVLTKWLNTDDWVLNSDLFQGLRQYAESLELQEDWRAAKQSNKARLARYLLKVCGVKVDENALFDVQAKRIHEYKRQLLNILSLIHRYNTIKASSPEEKARTVPRVAVFAGKSAAGYHLAKCVIHLINCVAERVNNDPEVGGLLTVIFIPNYSVSLAEGGGKQIIIPASDISQHISTAGMEASGTSNMKFVMNGGLIVGTMDGANIEIADAIGRENMFTFGALAEETESLRHALKYRQPASDERLSQARPYPSGLSKAASQSLQVFHSIERGAFGPWEDFRQLVESLRHGNDFYLLAHDWPSYLDAQLSMAMMGRFSSDRTIHEYARDIWNLQAMPAPRSSR